MGLACCVEEKRPARRLPSRLRSRQGAEYRDGSEASSSRDEAEGSLQRDAGASPVNVSPSASPLGEGNTGERKALRFRFQVSGDNDSNHNDSAPTVSPSMRGSRRREKHAERLSKYLQQPLKEVSISLEKSTHVIFVVEASSPTVFQGGEGSPPAFASGDNGTPTSPGLQLSGGEPDREGLDLMSESNSPDNESSTRRGGFRPDHDVVAEGTVSPRQGPSNAMAQGQPKQIAPSSTGDGIGAAAVVASDGPLCGPELHDHPNVPEDALAAQDSISSSGGGSLQSSGTRSGNEQKKAKLRYLPLGAEDASILQMKGKKRETPLLY